MPNPPSMRAPRAPRHWDQRFLALARTVAGYSKDPSTKVGAIAVRERRVLATGYNGFPAHVGDDLERLKNRDIRLMMTVHAEANIIAFAARHGASLAGAAVYVWPLMTCHQCAAQLIQAGVIKVVVPDFVEPLRWQESFAAAKQMFGEAGVAVLRIPMEGPLDPACDDNSDDDPLAELLDGLPSLA